MGTKFGHIGCIMLCTGEEVSLKIRTGKEAS